MDHICTWLARCQQKILSVKYKGFLALIPTPNSDREAFKPLYIVSFLCSTADHQRRCFKDALWPAVIIQQAQK